MPLVIFEPFRYSFPVIVERDHIENVLLEYLTESLIPDDFWEPVKVTLSESQINQLNIVEITDDCIICSEINSTFVNLNCCNQKMCTSCSSKWFKESVNCPYCKMDLRTYLNN